MIAERNPDIRGAVNTLYRLSEDPDVRARMEYREKAKRDHTPLLNAAEIRGETRGKALGEARGAARDRAEIARNMKRLGLSLDVIEKAAGLGSEAVKRL